MLTPRMLTQEMPTRRHQLKMLTKKKMLTRKILALLNLLPAKALAREQVKELAREQVKVMSRNSSYSNVFFTTMMTRTVSNLSESDNVKIFFQSLFKNDIPYTVMMLLKNIFSQDII